MATSEIPAVRRRDGVAVIDLAGDVNRGAEEPLEAAWERATSERPDAVVLNFEAAGYINSTGIALIVSLLARAQATGLHVRAYGLSPHYRDLRDHPARRLPGDQPRRGQRRPRRGREHRCLRRPRHSRSAATARRASSTSAARSRPVPRPC